MDTDRSHELPPGQVEYQTPQEMADLVDALRKQRGDTHAQLADLVGVGRSAVSHALNDPSPRRVRLLGQLLEAYGVESDPTSPAYPVRRPA